MGDDPNNELENKNIELTETKIIMIKKYMQ